MKYTPSVFIVIVLTITALIYKDSGLQEDKPELEVNAVEEIKPRLKKPISRSAYLKIMGKVANSSSHAFCYHEKVNTEAIKSVDLKEVEFLKSIIDKKQKKFADKFIHEIKVTSKQSNQKEKSEMIFDCTVKKWTPRSITVSFVKTVLDDNGNLRKRFSTKVIFFSQMEDEMKAFFDHTPELEKLYKKNLFEFEKVRPSVY